MAITRAQQIRQMLEDGGMLVKPSTTGKRPGYAGPAGGASAGGNYGGDSSGGVGANEMSGAGGGGGQGPAGGASAGGNYGGNRNPEQTYGGSIFGGGGGGPKGPPSVLNKPKAKPKAPPPKPDVKSKPSFFDRVKSFFSRGILGKTLSGLANSKLAQLNNAFQREQYLENLKETDPKAYAEVMGDLTAMGYVTSGVGPIDTKMGLDPTFKDLGEEQAKAILEGGRADPNSPTGLSTDYSDYQQKQMSRFTPEGGPDGNNSGITQALPLWAQLGFNSEAEYLASLNPATTTPTPSTRNFGGLAPRFAGSIFDFTGLADGGRAGFQTGGSSGVSMQNTLAQNIAANNAQAVANQKARGAISALLSSKTSQTSPATTTASMPSPSSMASTPSTSPMASTSFTSPQSSSSPSLSQMTTPPNVPSGTGGFTINTPTGPATFSGPGYFGSQGVMLDGKIYYSEEDAIKDLGIERYNQLMADGGRAGYMDGGMIEEDDPVGGIMDLESGRQMYFLGRLVKKATRAVKKVVKSPVGKLALGYALTGGLSNLAAGKSFGANFFSPSSFISRGGIKNIFTRGGVKNILFGQAPVGVNRLTSSGLLGSGGKFSIGKGLTLGFGIPAALDYFGVGKEKEEDGFDVEEYYRTQGIDVDAIRNSPYRFLAPRMVGSRFEQADGGLMRMGYQEGGDAEPVAKKTMPLLDMDGQEKDYRETGGFVDMGRMERADDVPARLSKNEFVFTADAVRNAGEGDVDKGAEVMYNMMKNLESGGEVSEESQGLDGAREMFKTSQRLEEVL